MDDFGSDIHREVLERKLKKNMRDFTEATKREVEDCEQKVKKEVMSAPMLHGADKIWYQGFKKTLSQNYLIGTNNYTKTRDEVVNILNTYNKNAKPRRWYKAKEAESGKQHLHKEPMRERT